VRIELGVLVFGDPDDRDKLTGYMEKPKVRYEASMGIYCFSPRALAHIERGETLDFPALITRLVDAGETVRAFKSDDYWLDIGRHDDYEAALDEFEEVKARLIPPG
jgi:NDP-sugar pyrophosphorylase family protein